MMLEDVSIRAARYIACDSHAHLASKAGSVISGYASYKRTSYAIRTQNRRWIACDSERDIA